MDFIYYKTEDECLVLKIKSDTEQVILFFEKELEESSWRFFRVGSFGEGRQIPLEFLNTLREQLKEE